MSEASEGLSSLDYKGSLWCLLSDLWDKRPVKALKVRLFCAGQSLPQTEIIFPNGLADLLGAEILEL